MLLVGENRITGNFFISQRTPRTQKGHPVSQMPFGALKRCNAMLFACRYFDFFTRSNSSKIKQIAPTVIALSAMLNAGKCQPRMWKSRKSTT